MIRKERFAPGEYYHVFSRTILSIPLFKDLENLQRLKQAFWVANSDNSGFAFQLLRNHKNTSSKEISEILNEGEKYVDVLCYTIMPDHYHLLLREIKENGVSDFIRKCNVAISKYINTKEDKKGPIFESRFNAKHVDDNKYLVHLSCYIHLNPLDILVDRSWRNHLLKNWKEAKKKLTDYPWSSVRIFLDEKFKDPIVSGAEIIIDQFKNGGEYESYLKDWSEKRQDQIIEYI